MMPQIIRAVMLLNPRPIKIPLKKVQQMQVTDPASLSYILQAQDSGGFPQPKTSSRCEQVFSMNVELMSVPIPIEQYCLDNKLLRLRKF